MTNVAADFHLNRLEFVYIHNSFTDGGSVSSFFRNMQQPRGIAKATISIFLASSACVVYAVTADNRAQANWILAEANKTRSKYTHILIGLEVDNSLSALAKKNATELSKGKGTTPEFHSRKIYRISSLAKRHGANHDLCHSGGAEQPYGKS